MPLTSSSSTDSEDVLSLPESSQNASEEECDMLVIFTHSYYIKIYNDGNTRESGRSLFATVHGLRYIEWTLRVWQFGQKFRIALERQTDVDIEGEFRMQLRVDSKDSRIECFPGRWQQLKHRIEYMAFDTEELKKQYPSDEFDPDEITIEIKLAFPLNSFNYIVPEICLNPLLRLQRENETDERLKALKFARIAGSLMYEIECIDRTIKYNRHCLYISCRYFQEYIDNNPKVNSIKLEFPSDTVEKVLTFAFTGIYEVRDFFTNIIANTSAKYQQFFSCLNFLKPLMYRELLQIYDDEFCRIFQMLCKRGCPPNKNQTLYLLRFAVRFNLAKLEACSIARIVVDFPHTYSSHLNVYEQPNIIDEMMRKRYRHEFRFKLGESPFQRIELLKAKSKDVFKYIRKGKIFSQHSLPTISLTNLIEAFHSLPTYNATEESDLKKMEKE